MQNKLHTIAAIAAAGALLLLSSGCTDEELVRQEGFAGGKTRITLGISTPAPVEIQTRAATEYENRIKDCWILRIAENTILSARKVTESQIEQNGTSNPVIVTDMLPNNGDRLVILANTRYNGQHIPSQLIGKEYTPTLVNGVFNLGASSFAGHNNNYGGVPMSGEIASYSRGGTNACTLTRSVAKIQLRLAPDLADDTKKFTDANISWGLIHEKYPLRYTILPPASEAVYKTETTFSESLATNYKLANSPDAEARLKQYYTPEFNTSDIAGNNVVSVTQWHKDRYCLLLKVEGAGPDGVQAGYYRIELTDAEKAYIFIRRNTDITVTIKKVKATGYSTAEQAVGLPGVNLAYDVHITHPESNITSSNGQYTLSTANNMAEIFGPAGREFEVVLATFTVAGQVMQGGALPPGLTGKVSLHNATPLGQIAPGTPTGVTLYTTALNLTGSTDASGAFTSNPTPINLSFTDKETKRFIVLISLGNLTQTVLVNHQQSFDASNGYAVRPGEIHSVRWLTQEASFRWENTIKNGNKQCHLIVSDNITPERWEEGSAGNYSRKDRLAAVPVFKALTADGYAEHSLEILNGVISQKNIIRFHVVQDPPVYVGWWGGVADSSRNKGNTFYNKRLIMESMTGREVESAWSTYAGGPVGYPLFNKFFGKERMQSYHNGVNNNPSTRELLSAFTYCYLRNDINRNGIIDTGEPIQWYLPSQAQLMGLWINLGNTGNETYLDEYYWSSTLQPREGFPPDNTGLNGANTEAFALSLKSGGVYADRLLVGQLKRIRCVRDID